MKKLIIIILMFFISIANAGNKGFKNFITTDGPKLMDGENQFRFLSFNIPNLNFVEDNLDFKTVYPFRLPTEFEIRDALMSIKQMGGRVVRMYTLPVKNLNYPDSVPAHVTGPGEFNEEAFVVNDMVLAIANELGIRIILPLLNQWKWLGGRPQYAAFRGKDEKEFYTDRQLIDDFKQTIEFTLNRTNTITGQKYKDDKAILCWETGNELVCPHEWTIEITRYIKSLDQNHLILDGYHAIDSNPVREESVLEPTIDIVHSHHYEVDPLELYENIDRNLKIVKGRKPYILGEFGFESTTALSMIIDKITNTPEIAGALTWSLRSHREEGGFYWHSEPLGLGLYKAYHWPGFISGKSYDEKNFLKMYRENAFLMQGKKVPQVPIPEAPVLLPITKIHSINWKGSVGASGYNIERTESKNGPWKLIDYNVSDAKVPYFHLFHDESAQIGKSYYYRVQAINSTGASSYSNIVGPVEVKSQALIDNMINYGSLYSSNGVLLSTGNDRRYKEKITRMKGQNGSEILYRVKNTIKTFAVYCFENSDESALQLSFSKDGKDFNPVTVNTEYYHQPGNNYGYSFPVLYSKDISIENYEFIKIEFINEAEIGRVEIFY